MHIIQQVVFLIAIIITAFLFGRQAKVIYRNIRLGRTEDFTGNTAERFRKMLLIAFGQKKMFKRPLAAFLHLLVYLGFILINIEVLEIVLDGVLGTHRLFAAPLGDFYKVVIGFFELLAIGVIVSCALFLARRFILRIARFHNREMKGWPTRDATYILVIEIVLMFAILSMNTADILLQQQGAEQYVQTGGFLISGLLTPIYEGLSMSTLIAIERVSWWAHILGIFAFLFYIPKSKHLHIFLAFPNTYLSKLEPQGQLNNMPEITKEIKAMMNPETAYAPPPGGEAAEPPKFGAKDVQDLNQRNLLNAYSCTECGRCTSVCPANQTGKLLSPRKIMMDTRDRLEEVGYNINLHGAGHDDGKSLLGDYIQIEELRACTTCNACVEECPVNINPLDIIFQLRRHLIMEESNSPEEWNLMFTNIENNGAPWQFSQQDRLKWADDLKPKA